MIYDVNEKMRIIAIEHNTMFKKYIQQITRTPQEIIIEQINLKEFT